MKNDLLLVLPGAAALVLYHVHLIYRARRNPLSTSIGLAVHMRTLWVRHVMENQKDIVAVQTLRNWTMAATFLASTAILIALGILSAALTTDKFELATVASGLAYEFDHDLKPLEHDYRAEPDELARAMQLVADRGKAKTKQA